MFCVIIIRDITPTFEVLAYTYPQSFHYKHLTAFKLLYAHLKSRHLPFGTACMSILAHFLLSGEKSSWKVCNPHTAYTSVYCYLRHAVTKHTQMLLSRASCFCKQMFFWWEVPPLVRVIDIHRVQATQTNASGHFN